MNIIPNELKITINTSIPGFQSIRYKPSMSFPDEKNDDTIYFNPLVKLNSSVIKSLPQEVQKKEFFNKGLFQSLINSHGLLKNKSLVEATKEGYVDNNIRVTLETIFPSNSVLYINKQPYAIADLQWTKGDWKIDKKTQQTAELESSKISDPYLYRTIVKDEIISGENELQKIPNEVIYGPNYTGPVNLARGVKPFKSSTNFDAPPAGPINKPIKLSGVTPISPAKLSKPSGVRPISPAKPSKPTILNKTSKTTKPTKPIPIPLSPKVSLAYEAKEREIQKQFLNLVQQQKQLLQQQQFVSQQLLKQENKLSKEKNSLFLKQQEQIRQEREKLNLQQQTLSQELFMLRMKFDRERLNMFRNKEIMDSNNKTPPLPAGLPPPKPFRNPFGYPALPPPGPEILDEEEIIKVPKKNIVLEPAKKSTEKLQNYFGNADYYFMLNTMFQNMETNEKKKINEIFKQSTGVEAKATKGLSKTAYDGTVQNMTVIKNAGGGDCFFIAVADAINYYNANVNADVDKIVYRNHYGVKTPFTQLTLRKIVSYFILLINEMHFDQLVNILEENVKDMNVIFQMQYNDHINNVGPVTPDIFSDLINNLYHNEEIDSFLVKKPTEMTAKTVKDPFRMITKNELETYITSSDYWGNPIAINALCEILGLNVIVIENKNDVMRIPYIYDGNKEWNKYLFIYNEVDHYELITFDYIFNNKQAPVTKTIFKNNYLTPPFYIIFLIFASNYFKIRDQNDKKNFKLLPILMQKLLDIYKKIDSNVTNTKSKNKKNKQESSKFLKLLNDYFLRPPIIPIRSRSFDNSSIFDIDDDESNPSSKGGALTPYQYRMNNQYQNQRRRPYVSSLVRKNTSSYNENSKTNISYYITIDLYLKKGTELSNKDISDLKCNHRWNSIKKSYANLRGLNYVNTPDYNTLSTSSTSNNKNKTNKNLKSKNMNYSKTNRTKKNYNK